MNTKLPIKSTNPREAIEDALIESGSHAIIWQFDQVTARIEIAGDYADLLLARKVLARFPLAITEVQL